MNDQEYLELRLKDQIKWYSKKASNSKKYHIIFKGLIIILSASIPLLAGLNFDNTCKNVFLAIIGFIIAVLAGLSSLFKFHENWTEYRTTSETLKHEELLYLTKSGPYENETNSFNELVIRVENLISKENSQWSQYVNK